MDGVGFLELILFKVKIFQFSYENIHVGCTKAFAEQVRKVHKNWNRYIFIYELVILFIAMWFLYDSIAKGVWLPYEDIACQNYTNPHVMMDKVDHM